MAKKSIVQEGITSAQKSVLAREGDGTVQLTVTIRSEDIKKNEGEVLAEIAKTTDIPGYRRGNAPIGEVKKKASQQTVIERILSKVLPQTYQAAVIEHKIRPILSPQFHLVSAESDKDWQIRIITCESPTIELGDYKKEIEAAKRARSSRVPGKVEAANSAGGKKLSPDEKEQLVIDTLLKTSQCSIPKPLLDEEVNHRLAGLVDQTQKLGLTIEQYLAQTGKTADQLREEYRGQARQQLHAVLALSRVAENEKIGVSDTEIESFANSKPGNGEQKPLTGEQKQLLKSILLRRRALDALMNMA